MSRTRSCSTRLLAAMLPASLLVVPSALAQKSKKAHEHGSATLDVFAEAKTVTLDFVSPAEAIIGFEHEAKSDADKAKQAQGLSKLKDRVADIVILDKALECKFVESKADVVRDVGGHGSKGDGKKHGHHGHHGHGTEHSEVKATFKVECAKAVAGTSVQLDFASVFPGVRKIAVQVISGEKQRGYNLRKKGFIEL